MCILFAQITVLPIGFLVFLEGKRIQKFVISTSEMENKDSPIYCLPPIAILSTLFGSFFVLLRNTRWHIMEPPSPEQNQIRADQTLDSPYKNGTLRGLERTL
jgi:hypothetical protein